MSLVLLPLTCTSFPNIPLVKQNSMVFYIHINNLFKRFVLILMKVAISIFSSKRLTCSMCIPID